MNQSIFNKLIPWHVRTSWGTTAMNTDGNTLSFRVNGNKYAGTVAILEDNSCGRLLIDIAGNKLSCRPGRLRRVLDKLIES